MPNEVIKGKINYVLSGLIEVKTKDGIKKVSRESQKNQIRDIVEIGFLKKKKISGEVYYLDNDELEIATPSGKIKINRFWVRDILLSQQDLPNL